MFIFALLKSMKVVWELIVRRNVASVIESQHESRLMSMPHLRCELGKNFPRRIERNQVSSFSKILRRVSKFQHGVKMVIMGIMTMSNLHW